MAQLVDKDTFIDMVQMMGIERAYENRYRRTGKTVRAALKVVLAVSEGKRVVVIQGNKNTNEVDLFFEKVRRLFSDVGMIDDMKVAKKNYFHYGPSGGKLSLWNRTDENIRMSEYDMVIEEI